MRSKSPAQDMDAHVRANSNDLLYAVAVRDGADLWLVLWVKRSTKSEYFVMFPRDEPGWDPHASYHRDGSLHQKSHDRKMLVFQRQVPGPAFKGTETWCGEGCLDRAAASTQPFGGLNPPDLRLREIQSRVLR